MKWVRNLQELPSGFISCETLNGVKWKPHNMRGDDEYEIHESSEWQDIKPCDQAEKDAHQAEQERAELIAQIAALDLPLYTLERALAGDVEAQEKIATNELEKQKLRVLLK